jgi:hypothetical protein
MTISPISDIESNFDVYKTADEKNDVKDAVKEPLKNIDMYHAFVHTAGKNEAIHGKKILKLTDQSRNLLNQITDLNQIEQGLEALLDSDKGVEVPEHLKSRLEKFGLEKNAKLTKTKKEAIKKDIVNRRDLLKLEFQATEPEIRKILYHIESVHKCALEAIRMKREEDRKAAELPR